jgi:outer membrane protein insertion porin family
MRRLHPLWAALALLLLGGGGAVARAQDSTQAGPCATPDSVAFRGNSRITDDLLRADVGIVPRKPVSARELTRAIRNLYATGQFEANIETTCDRVNGKTTLIFLLKERRVLSEIKVTGVEKLSQSSVRDRIDLAIGRPIDPAQVAKSVARIDSVYQSAAFTVARVKVDTTIDKEATILTFHVEEGSHIAVSGIDVQGNRALSDKTVVSGMSTKPEGFLWWHKGEFDLDKWSADLAEKIPSLYASRGMIDAQVVRDSVIVDRNRGKALLQVQVNEGPQYKVGTFEIVGAKHFQNEELARFYPFGDRTKGITETVKDLFRRSGDDAVFNRALWEDATRKVQTLYANQGYMAIRIRPIEDRHFVGKDSVPTVDLRWEIDEGSPAIVNRVDIVGNDVTIENCIRDQLFILPGDVLTQDMLINSWRNIANLGFFEQDMPFPETRPVNERGDIDLIFHVKEKRTGNVNFGASVGQGTGVGGFVGFNQPNLFGLCKVGSLQWQFGRYISDFNLSYTDPRIKQSQVSGTVNAYHQRSRFIIRDIGTSVRTGGQLRFGFLLPNSRNTRFYVDYGGERVKYGGEGLVGTINCNNCFRSTLGFTLDHDSRFGQPFPFTGTHQSISTQLNGGPLGGSASFQRVLGEMKTYATLAQFGGATGSAPIALVLALSSRAGAVFGDPGPFFVSQAFSLGGVQFGEPLRGYEEFSITPKGFLPEAGQFQAQRSSFGNAFYTSSLELGVRLNQQMYLDAFYDVGNLWDRPRDFDPTRLFRGAGVGASLVTPLGPLGIDLGYGFDRVDALGRKDPKWQVHFKFGQIF